MALPDLTDQFVADAYMGVLHTSNIPLSGSNLPPVYDGLGNRSSLNLGAYCNGASICGTLSATSLILDDYSFIGAFMHNFLYPVGSIFLSFENTNPSLRFIGTTWIQTAHGHFLGGVGMGTDINTVTKNLSAGENDGEYEHTLTIDELPPHQHNVLGRDERFGRTNSSSKQSVGTDPTSIKGITSNVGGGDSHNNVPPSFGVYVWRRTL